MSPSTVRPPRGITNGSCENPDHATLSTKLADLRRRNRKLEQTASDSEELRRRNQQLERNVTALERRIQQLKKCNRHLQGGIGGLEKALEELMVELNSDDISGQGGMTGGRKVFGMCVSGEEATEE